MVFGHPWFGVWLSVGAMCAALYWAFIAWLPPKWSLLAGALTAIHLGLLSYWGESYWGGAGAAIGGALVVGAVPRLRRQVFRERRMLVCRGPGNAGQFEAI